MYNEALASSFIDAISGKINTIKGKFQTIYIGGGTPTALSRGQLGKLLRALERCRDKSSEFTIEVNPESLDADKASLFFERGVNRLSIGAQSFQDGKLKELGRMHNAGAIEDTLSLARKIGFKNLSIDLIFGSFGEGIKDWEEDLKRAASSGVEHISCYSLTYEKKADEEAAARMYEYAISYLSQIGLKQYEISNFALDGYACRHNLNYWENGPYLGLGPSAVSYSNGVREENIHDISEYIRRLNNKEPSAMSSEKLGPERSARETAAIKIRTMEGIDFAWFKDKAGFLFLDLEKDSLPRLIEEALVEYMIGRGERRGVRLTHKGILFCDLVSSAFM